MGKEASAAEARPPMRKEASRKMLTMSEFMDRTKSFFSLLSLSETGKYVGKFDHSCG